MHSVSADNVALDALLASYATGSLSRPLHALVASHLALKPDNRRFVAALEQLAADGLDEAVEATVSKRDARLAAIFDHTDSQSKPALVDSILPSPLAAYVGTDFDRLNWKSVMPGLKEVKLEDRAGLEASLLWIRAGRAMPAHTHPGIEATLVLRGSFSDKSGQFLRGDMAVVDSDVDHKPVAGDADDCICFAVSEGPVKLTGTIARIFQRLVRH